MIVNPTANVIKMKAKMARINELVLPNPGKARNLVRKRTLLNVGNGLVGEDGVDIIELVCNVEGLLGSTFTIAKEWFGLRDPDRRRI